MSLPHHGYWDRLCVSVDPAPSDFDRPLPRIGKLRRAQRGPGYMLGRALRTLRAINRTSVTSKRFRVLVWRQKWLLLSAFGWCLLWPGLILLFATAFTLDFKYLMGAVLAVTAASALYSTIRRHEHEAWPLMALKQRRCALMYGSRRYRQLHVDAGFDQSSEQIERYIASRRIHWRERLVGLKYGQRNAFAYREFWWLSLPTVLFFVFYFYQAALGSGFPYGVFTPFLLIQAFTFLVPSFVASRRLKRLRRSLEEFSCPDCGYPLADFALGSWRGHQVQGLGPRRCTECGCPWPLVPPPRGRAAK